MRMPRLLPALLAIASMWATTAHADVVLNFEGLNGNAMEAPWIITMAGPAASGLAQGRLWHHVLVECTELQWTAKRDLQYRCDS